MINVNINPILKVNLDSDLFVNASQATFTEVDPDKETDVSLVITDDAQIRNLNRQFREIDNPTDVLSFPSGEVDLDSGKHYLGDIIISYQQAHLQAIKAGHSVETELQLLTIHGMLHLLGFDHSNEEEKAEMWAVQTRTLEKLGLTDINILEEQD